MGMNIVRFSENGSIHWGVLFGDEIKILNGHYSTLSHFLTAGIKEARSIHVSYNARTVTLKEVRLLSPITQPARILCQGANYSSHRAASGLAAERAPFNVIFSKADSSLSGPYSDIVCPPNIKLLDYEIELGLVIGKSITGPTYITDDNLHEFVAGIVIANDLSAREIQLPQGQWQKGKSFRTFCPTGPYLYLLDKEDIPYIHNLELKLSVNNEIRQHANTSQLLFKPAETLSELSEIMDLSPGDLILTGTAGGAAMKIESEVIDKILNPFFPGGEKMKLFVESQQNNDRYLKAGDIIRSEIYSTDGKIQLGEQVNIVVQG